MKKLYYLITIIVFFLLTSCQNQSFNDPHQKNKTNQVIYYSSFSSPPKTLDPARSYSADENIFIAQILEPPLQYNYFIRPYQLEPLTAQAMPIIQYYDKDWHLLPENASADSIAYTVYTIAIKPNIFYQPHPAFAKNGNGQYLYDHLSKQQAEKIENLSDFPKMGTRELVANDYVYEIKRLASPANQSPVLSVFSPKILGMPQYTDELLKVMKSHPGQWINLNDYPLAGAKVLDKYHYQIILKGKYPQFEYWLAMTFFAPIPWEADKFYAQAGLAKNNINFNWYPVGTGAYYLAKNDPNSEIILKRNPNFNRDIFGGNPLPRNINSDEVKKLGLNLPMIDEFDFSLEKESIPRWVKFLQGYYDASGISSDNFDQTIQIDANGNPRLSKNMAAKKFKLQTATSTSIFYLGFNMLDPVIGGYSEKQQQLRQAISIAVNFEEFVAIFLNGRAQVAQGPIPPGIFGYQAGEKGIDPYVYDWENNQPQRKSLNIAKQLLAKAGYPNGVDPKTGKPLTLTLSVTSMSGGEDKAEFDWLRQEFALLGINLNIASTDYNRFQDKLQHGIAQIYFFGWNADYPDPENFLFLLYGKNSAINGDGANYSNYDNPEFNKLFVLMKDMPNNQERENIIRQMLHISQQDAPWVFGIVPTSFSLTQQWVYPVKPSTVIQNYLKYVRINPVLRAKMQAEWNHPIVWPFILLFIICVLIMLPVIFQYRKQFYQPKEKKLE